MAAELAATVTHIVNSALHETIDWNEHLERILSEDPEFRAVWDAEILARTFALAVVKYRAERNLSQTALGRIVGMTQPQIARIEDGERTPSLPTMLRVCDTLGLEVELRIGPRADGSREVPKTLQRGVWDASDQVIVAIRERSVRA